MDRVKPVAGRDRCSPPLMEKMTEDAQKELHFIKDVLDYTCRIDSRSELLWHFDKEGKLNFCLCCSDTFAWGCSDAEYLTPDNLHVFKQSIQDVRDIDPRQDFYAVALFACRIRQQRPMKRFLNLIEDQRIVKLLEDCGPPCVEY